MAIPEFVTKELFEKALRTYFNNKDVCILDYQNQWAVPPGDNFTSDLLRSRLTYTLGKNGNSKTISVLVKVFPETRDAIANPVKEMNLFQKEIEMYTKILPEVYSILGNSETFSAQCFYTEQQPVPLLILEDLSPLGYKMLNRRDGLDLEHCLLVMKKVAQLHAASILIYKRNPTAFSNYNDAMYCEHPFIIYWINIGIECTAKTCKERPGLEKYALKLEKLKATFLEKCLEVIKPKSGELAVLNHGDCWTNNFMFLYDVNGKLKDVKLIDYQLGVYSGPGVDLQYFWNTTPNMFVRRKHLDTVLKYYFDELLSTLTRINYPTRQLPLQEDIYKDFYAKAYYGFAAGVSTLPLIKSDSREDALLEELLKPLDEYGGSFREHVYTNALSCEYFEHILPFLDKLGIFD